MKKNNKKNNDNNKDNNLNKDKIIKKMSFVSVVGNVFLSIFKLLAGLVGNSTAMLSDAIHSISDVLTTIIAAVGVKLSDKKADVEHPYGHERIECIAAIILAFILILVGFQIGMLGLDKILHPADVQIPSLIALIAAIVSIGVKEAMYHYTVYYAKKINSTSFLADAWHHRSDAMSSVGSLIGILGARLGVKILDPIASLVICLFIFKVGIDILRDAIKKVTDTACDSEFEKQLNDFILKQKDVKKIDLLHTRIFGNRVYVDVEIALDGNLSLTESHAISEMIHDELEENFKEVKHVMIHVNPAVEK